MAADLSAEVELEALGLHGSLVRVLGPQGEHPPAELIEGGRQVLHHLHEQNAPALENSY